MNEKNPSQITKTKDFDSSLVSPTGYYSVTINPESQYWDSPSRLTSWLRHVHTKLVRIDPSFKYLLFIEISKRGRLHLHGYFRLDTDQLIDFYLSVPRILEGIGQFEIDTVANYETWYNYIQKDQVITNWERYLSETVFKYPLNGRRVRNYVRDYVTHTSTRRPTCEVAPKERTPLRRCGYIKAVDEELSEE